MDQQRGRPVLLEFSDLVRPSSLRTTDYLKAWHARYGEPDDGLRVITVFAPSEPFAADPEVAEQIVLAAGIEHPVLLDLELRLWQIYENEGWPSRYLFDRQLRLYEHHQGEGGYEETEVAIRELCEESPASDVIAPLHPIDAPDAALVVPTADQPGGWSGAYEAGEAWAIVEGRGSLTVNGETQTVAGAGPVLLARHDEHTAGELVIEPGDGVCCHGVCFSPGLAPAPQPA